MVRVWISPEGEDEVLVAGREGTHLDQAEQAVRIRGYGTPWIHDMTPSVTLLANHWVRVSSGYVEGQADDIRRHWSRIVDFLQSDVLHLGVDYESYIDLTDEHGKRLRSIGPVALGKLASIDDPVFLLRPSGFSEELQRFRQRRAGVRVHGYRRRR